MDPAVPESEVARACGEMDFPEMGVIEQGWDVDPIPPKDVEDRAASAVRNLDFAGVPEGGEIAVAAGSRGIANLAAIGGGVAVVEDEHDDTTIIEGVPAADFLDRERELLETARARMPTLPFDELDVLVVDQLGKDVSGQGMDTNVTGRRHFTIAEPEPESPEIKRVYARSRTSKTKGNAMGMGAADFVHRDLAAAVDTSKSLINAITASTVRGVRLPPVVDTDRAGLTAALGTVGPVSGPDARVLRVTDTMRLERC